MEEEVERWSKQAKADLKSAKNSLKRGSKMRKKNAIIRELGKFKGKLSSDIPLRKMILFGSMATGRAHKDSDIDLILVSDKFRGKKSFRRSIGFYKYWDLDYPVDFLCYTPEEFNKLKNQISIVREAIRKGIEI
ncbi:nucleotidyltransferase domain-containing protein [Candidatus Woesearchaeota archaeon]|nr:nucleotidyltransferase domain-containing protein [Candidatus Woesearchaeota archaeon]